MGISTSEVEALAVSLYRRLGFDPASPVDTYRLARALLGPRAIERGTAIAGVPAKLFTVHGKPRIAVSRKLAVPYARFFVGHELGHVVFDELGYREHDIEAACDMFGAALLAPIPAVLAMLRTFGRDHEAIAGEIGSTQTHAALRIAECLGIPRALVTPKRLYVRGPEDFAWGTEGELRQMARGAPLRGVTKVMLTDDPRRVLLDVEEFDAA